MSTIRHTPAQSSGARPIQNGLPALGIRHYCGNLPALPPFPHYEKRALPRPAVAASTLSKITKEAVLLLSLFLIAATFQFFAQSLPMALCFYFLPTMYSAYYFGRRHATLTAFASVFLVLLLQFVNNLLPSHPVLALPGERLFNLAIWAGILAVTGYAMGSLYERAQGMTSDLRESFGGLLLVLQHFIASEKHSSSETQRVVDASVKVKRDVCHVDPVALLVKDLLASDVKDGAIPH